MKFGPCAACERNGLNDQVRIAATVHWLRLEYEIKVAQADRAPELPPTRFDYPPQGRGGGWFTSGAQTPASSFRMQRRDDT